ncbi:MAG: PDC sensor domain-containing protein, partial [Acidithiobacillus sp.]|nr:PDC sensor domain-containing protein [Acidithiobacillus sp.]
MNVRDDRRILWGATAFFVALAIFFTSVAIWRAYDLRQSLTAHFRDQAKVVATQNAVTLAATINAYFHDLAFLKNAFFANGTGQLLPSAQVRSAFTVFQRTHTEIAAINIDDPSGNRIVWSSTKNWRNLNITNKFSTSLPKGQNKGIGQIFYSRTKHAWILPMRQRIRDNEGQVLGFIGSPFILANLDTIHTPPDLQSMVVTDSQGQVVSVWKNGQWMPPNTPLPPSAGEVAVPVPGYPWHLQVQWTAATLQHAFWKVQRTRLPIFLTGL